LVISDLHVGGAERALVELATRLDRRRFEPVVYCLLPPPPEEQSALVDALQAAQIRVEFLHARGWWSLPRVVGALWRSFSRQRPRLVQGLLFHANFVGSLAAWLASVPVVVSGIRVAEPRPSHLRLARWTDCLVRKHVCVSQSVADYSHRTGGLPQEKLVVIPNGVDVDRFTGIAPADLQEFGFNPGRRAITFVGRLDAQKGLGWLLHLASKAFEQIEEHDLLIVGHGPARAMLERIVRELNLGDRVHFTGWKANVPAILAASDVLVLPSRWEGMPNAVLEAMAAGKPVVASDVEGVRELLGPDADAQSAPAGDADGFLRRLVVILDSPLDAVELGARNRRRVLQEFGLRQMVRKYENLYTSMLCSDVLAAPVEDF
jgi:glycosyltransferase involved in cell wall biosynthesis